MEQFHRRLLWSAVGEWDLLSFVGDEEAFDECGERLNAVSEALEWARARAA